MTWQLNFFLHLQLNTLFMKKFNCLLFSFLFYAIPFVSQTSFSESSAALGMNISYGESDLGGGVSFIDFNNDGWDDITFATEDTEEICFLKNTNGILTQVYFTGISNTLKTKQIMSKHKLKNIMNKVRKPRFRVPRPPVILCLPGPSPPNLLPSSLRLSTATA